MLSAADDLPVGEPQPLVGRHDDLDVLGPRNGDGAGDLDAIASPETVEIPVRALAAGDLARHHVRDVALTLASDGHELESLTLRSEVPGDLPVLDLLVIPLGALDLVPELHDVAIRDQVREGRAIGNGAEHAEVAVKRVLDLGLVDRVPHRGREDAIILVAGDDQGERAHLALHCDDLADEVRVVVVAGLARIGRFVDPFSVEGETLGGFAAAADSYRGAKEPHRVAGENIARLLVAENLHVTWSHRLCLSLFFQVTGPH